MAAVFRHSLSRLRTQIVGWGLTFALLGWITTWAYDSIMSTQSQWQQMLDSFPPSVMAFFGETTKAFEADGYLDVGLFSYAVVILAFFGIILGSGLMASDEEAGRLDLIQAHPVSRGKQFWGRLLASTAATIAILFMTWTGLAVGLYGSELPAGVADLAVVCLPVLAEVMLFATLALLLSMLMPSRSMAASVASIVLVASYAVTSLARVFSGLKGSGAAVATDVLPKRLRHQRAQLGVAGRV